jgi:MoaA/NifB/PqqE/SkfB family radical SAM enzyme
MNVASFYDAWNFIKTLTIHKIWNGFLLRMSYAVSKISGKNIHWGKPEFLSIEPVNLCNLKCPECPTGTNQLTRSKDFISKESFWGIIEQSERHLSFLQLYFQGEPFMHPQIYDFIKIAVQNKIYTATSTNGHFLTTENCQRIIDSGLHRIIISVDGNTQDTYSKYRVGGSLKTVIQGITNLTVCKKKQKSHHPFIIIQFVVFKTNEHQIEEVRKLAKKLNADRLILKSAQIEDYRNGNEIMTSIQKYNRYRRDKAGQYQLKRPPDFKCLRIWNGAVIASNQEVLPCCFDKDANYAYGTVQLKSLNGLFNGTKATDLRKQVWGEPTTRPEICANCTEGLRKSWYK